MNKYLLYMFLMLGTIQQFHSQESNGTIALVLPVRNSLKFNRYALNPTFSFVREQNKYLSFTNKRQWAQFNNAPESYLFSYSGRFAENIGAGVGVFQQNIGVLTTFGGMLNFAYNANLGDESNFTFGLNVGAYQSGINQGKIIVNTPDSSLNNIPSSFLFTVNPGINYGTGFLDFGVSINNLVVYNLNTSEIIEENPEQAFQGHVMYTGYMNSSGFFDESKFSTLIRSEFKKDQTILSGVAMLTVPKGIWVQAGYNTVFGASVGLGINVTKNIAIEYNYEQSMGSLSEFGSSHEITVAYRFNKKYSYSYGDYDEEQSVFNSRTKKVKASSISAEEKARVAERRAAIEAERKARIAADKKTVDNAPTEDAQVIEENVDKKKVQENVQAIEKAKEIEDSKVEEENRLKIEAEQKAKSERVRLESETKEKEELAIKRQEEQKRLDAIAKAKALEETKAKEEARLKLEAEQKAETERKRLEAEIKRKDEIAVQEAQLEEEKRARLEQEKKNAEALAAKEKLEVEQKAKAQIEADVLPEEAVSDVSQTGDTDTTPEELKDEPEAEDEESKSLKDIAKAASKAKKEQRELLNDLSEKVAIKQEDLNDLKEENDLSEQGVYQAPKKFKSLSAENATIEKLKKEIEKVEKEQEAKMIELEALLIKRKRKFRKDRRGINNFYKDVLEQLKEEQLKIKKYKSSLITNLERIKVATDYERKRRISRAAYDNQQDRYNKDKAALERIKKFTDESATPLTEEDFDFGEEQTKNIQIVNNVLNEEPGYYMVIAVHNSVEKRDEFLTKVVASGEKNVNFFFDVKTNKYFIYYQKFNQIGAAKNALEEKDSKPYNSKMSLVKIEN